MRRENPNNKMLDAIGRRLIEGQSFAPADIDKIISNPRLFELTRARVLAERSAGAPGFRGPVLASFAALVVIVGLIAAGITMIPKENPRSLAFEHQVPGAQPETARPVIPPQGTEPKPEAGRAVTFEPSARRVAHRPVKSTRARPRRTPSEPAQDFYAISFTDDPAETGAGSRIVRVDLSRSALFALGVSLSLENADETVKTDLLVGSDGVTRGVRVVR